ncbi:proline-rich receptor-like protein kinase PERK8 [Oryx dammah]|uniref:proline-rich receptor-like protein kinase PERK8 n=1 Tax=Oryx dammah TaxID=59534 RepID=UPI001A9ABFC9|nr:proline-rich receptor-like protein kinase PERK8 [Oryx dammah]
MKRSGARRRAREGEGPRRAPRAQSQAPPRPRPSASAPPRRLSPVLQPAASARPATSTPPRPHASAPPRPTSWAGTRRPLPARFPRQIWCLGGGGGRGGVRGGRGRGTGSQPCRRRPVRTREASASRLGTMGLGARGFLTLLALGVVLGVALLKVFTDSADPEGSASQKNPMSGENSNDNQAGNTNKNDPKSAEHSNDNQGVSSSQNNPQSGGNSNGKNQAGEF